MIIKSNFINHKAGLCDGAIYLQNDSDIPIAVSSINESTFIGNKAKEWSGVIGLANVELNIDKSTFKKNEVTDAAGGIVIMSRPTGDKPFTILNVSNSSFEENKAMSGGVIANYDTLSISNSNFVKNIADKDTNEGGCARFLGSVMSTYINNTKFIGNASNKFTGGAIDTRDAEIDGNKNDNSYAKLDIINLQFNSNIAKTNWGALSNTFFGSVNNANAVTVSGFAFDRNSAEGNGGVIYNDVIKDKGNNYAAIAISNSSFTNNNAGAAGGAIYNSANVTISFSDVNIFSNNTTRAEGVKNDISNLGIINVINGETTLDGGITGDSGTVNINGGTLNTNISKASENVNIKGGTLAAAKIDVDSNITLLNEVLKTTANQVMRKV